MSRQGVEHRRKGADVERSFVKDGRGTVGVGAFAFGAGVAHCLIV
jgi:hypothetical protein